MKSFKIEHKILLAVIVVLIMIILTSQIINKSTDYKLIKEVEKISTIMAKEKPNKVGTIMYEINNNLSLENKTISSDVKGKGIVFLDKDNTTTIVLENFNKCAIKLPNTEGISVLNEKCAKYTLKQGAKLTIDNSKGVYKSKDDIIYRGKYVNNYIVYDNEYWRIIAFTNQGIKIMSEYSMGEIAYGNGNNDFTNSNLNYFLNDYQTILPNIKEISWNIGSSIGDKKNKIIKNEQEKTISSKAGLLTLSDYLNAMDGTCKIKNDSIKCPQDTYINPSNDFWLMTPYTEDQTKAWAVNKNKNMYIDNITSLKSVIPVITLDERYIITDGEGTKESPYILTYINKQ